MAGQLRNWGRLRSLTLKGGEPGDASELGALLHDLANATQLHSVTWVLSSHKEGETRLHSELSGAMVPLRREHPELQLRLVLE